jgi:hypothetical protein
MTRHTLLLGAVFMAALVVSMSAHPAATASESQTAFAAVQPESVPAAQVHGVVSASFHTMNVGF